MTQERLDHIAVLTVCFGDFVSLWDGCTTSVDESELEDGFTVVQITFRFIKNVKL